MVDKDILLAKVGNIQTYLKRIQTVTRGSEDSLENIDTQDIFVLNLQRAIQSAIDLAAHIIADEGLGLPESLKENFILLNKADILSTDLTKKMTAMVGFRNIAVHDYQNIDSNILKSIFKKHLIDFELFYKEILTYYKLADNSQ